MQRRICEQYAAKKLRFFPRLGSSIEGKHETEVGTGVCYFYFCKLVATDAFYIIKRSISVFYRSKQQPMEFL